MVCIFAGLYFLFIICSGAFKDKKRLFTLLFVFAISTIATLLFALPFLIKVAKSLSGQKTSQLSSVFDFKISYRPGALLFNMLPGQFNCDFSNVAAPYVYVGIMSLICILFFFLSKKISLEKKTAYGILLIVMFGSSFISGLDCIWHGFNNPVGFSHRQSFLIVSCLLMIGAEGMNAICECCDSTGNKLNYKIVGIVSIAIVIFQLLELGSNAILSLKAYETHEMKSQKEYEDYYIKNKEIINMISQYNQDDNIYRIEKDYARNHNDAMMLSYNGLSHNSSCESENVKIFIGRMGFRNQGIWSAYRGGSTSFADSLLGVKYFISKFDETNKPYNYIFEYMSSYVYENPYALNIVWPDTKEHISSVNIDNPNLFEIQNQIAECDIYKPLDYSEKCEGMTKEIIDIKKTDMSYENTDNILGVKNTGSGTLSSYPDELYQYNVNSSDDNAAISYKVKITQDGNMYCYFSAPVQQGALLYINGNLWDDYFSDYRWGIVNCGKYQAGDEVTISLKPTGNRLSLFEAYFYEENIEALSKWYSSINSKGLNVTKKSSLSYIINNNNTEEGKNFYVFSIPYDNWSITIDGKKASPVMVYDCLLGVEAPDGWKEICIKY